MPLSINVQIVVHVDQHPQSFSLQIAKSVLLELPCYRLQFAFLVRPTSLAALLAQLPEVFGCLHVGEQCHETVVDQHVDCSR